jgi:hypothetical protein
MDTNTQSSFVVFDAMAGDIASRESNVMKSNVISNQPILI